MTLPLGVSLGGNTNTRASIYSFTVRVSGDKSWLTGRGQNGV